MKKIRILSILMSVVFLLLFSWISYADVPIFKTRYTVEDFVFLRDCVLAEDEAGIISFFKERGVSYGGVQDPYDLARFDYGRILLETLDEFNIIAIEGASEATYKFEINTDYANTLTDFCATYNTSAWKITYCFGQLYANAVSDVEDSDFVLETVDGEIIKFKYRKASKVYEAITDLSGTTTAILISFDAEKTSFEDIGKVKFVPFSELTSVAGSATTDLTDSGGTTDALPEIDLKWWYIALPVGGGIAVVGSLAAVLLLRKKKKTE